MGVLKPNDSNNLLNHKFEDNLNHFNEDEEDFTEFNEEVAKLYDPYPGMNQSALSLAFDLIDPFEETNQIVEALFQDTCPTSRIYGSGKNDNTNKDWQFTGSGFNLTDASLLE